MNKLDIYVSSGCLSCRRAREIASSLQGTYPGVRVEVVEAESAPAGSLPESVVALPAYILDGRLVSLGNPNPVTLREQLAALALGRS
jgi:predicted thioredoxin/glutaredoxin